VESVAELGENLLVVWKPDSSMIAVASTGGHVIFYNIVVYTEVQSEMKLCQGNLKQKCLVSLFFSVRADSIGSLTKCCGS
jgi:hypothetical protein